MIAHISHISQFPHSQHDTTSTITRLTMLSPWLISWLLSGDWLNLLPWVFLPVLAQCWWGNGGCCQCNESICPDPTHNLGVCAVCECGIRAYRFNAGSITYDGDNIGGERYIAYSEADSTASTCVWKSAVITKTGHTYIYWLELTAPLAARLYLYVDGDPMTGTQIAEYRPTTEFKCCCQVAFTKFSTDGGVSNAPDTICLKIASTRTVQTFTGCNSVSLPTLYEMTVNFSTGSCSPCYSNYGNPIRFYLPDGDPCAGTWRFGGLTASPTRCRSDVPGDNLNQYWTIQIFSAGGSPLNIYFEVAAYSQVAGVLQVVRLYRSSTIDTSAADFENDGIALTDVTADENPNSVWNNPPYSDCDWPATITISPSGVFVDADGNETLPADLGACSLGCTSCFSDGCSFIVRGDPEMGPAMNYWEVNSTCETSGCGCVASIEGGLVVDNLGNSYDATAYEIDDVLSFDCAPEE
jgi:hypothetical protein